jgi:aminocarboxymuconate-semialdehyde decarboxylase
VAQAARAARQAALHAEDRAGGLRAIHLDGAPFMTPVPEMFDWDLRIRNMDRAGIDRRVVSLTCPNCYWGSARSA